MDETLKAYLANKKIIQEEKDYISRQNGLKTLHRFFEKWNETRDEEGMEFFSPLGHSLWVLI